ncbi:Por secretion system C-terminal sorting domain-containing protein [Chryseobacterium polytrichastri]|uniref:Por secretion system C-terminal sorting domain-containing protein n=2 Tax=Chryseobacterium polytrichastri TaxID=1302687 RepID=A0A1M7APR4_9FLAO|nr:Por secretion system C-terminal sorting domain-containing protein [Chryseobacterium polytrichastri]
MSAFAQIPTGYYNGTTGLSGPALKTKLSQIITNGHQDNGYNGLWAGYQTTDIDRTYENDGTILDMYSENPTGPDPYNFNYGTSQCGTYSSEGNCYNREHVVPQSLFNQGLPMRSDIHFIRATDGKVNGMRSNYPYGKVGSASFTSLNGSKLGTSISPNYSGIVFEPIDAFKGDIARMILYFVTRYESQLAGFSSGNMLGGSAFPGLQQWELNQLLAWNALDPVSSAEEIRNNASYVYQGNRNPYIDHPEYVDQIWGTVVVDNQPPTAATNLVANNPTSNSIALNWTAATDNIAVTSYEIYANGVLKATVAGTSTSTTVIGLSPLTQYTFYIIAKDAAGNSSPQSNNAIETTLNGPAGGSCGTEDFEMITGAANTYLTATWTNNGITWTATDSRVDQTINNKAITIRDGSLTSSTISGGIQSLSVKAQLKFAGNPGNLNVQINGTTVGTIPYSSTSPTTPITINNINISGDIIIKIVNPISSNRVAIDDLSWTCNTTLGTAETTKQKAFSIYPNPVKNNELFVKGENLTKISKAEIYDLSGKLIQVIANPFKNSNKINLQGLVKGNYVLKTDLIATKFVVE